MPKGRFRYNDLGGRRFGKLVAIEISGLDKWKQIHWSCSCDCGKKCSPLRRELIRGEVTSCGCSRGMVSRFKPTHGCSRKINGKPTPEYSSWLSMRSRCRNGSKKAHLYANRGIIVCDSWEKSFDAFVNDMGSRPIGHTLDRVNVNGNYEPSNCRWATVKEQASNRRYPTQMQHEINELKAKLLLYESKFGPLNAS